MEELKYVYQTFAIDHVVRTVHSAVHVFWDHRKKIGMICN